jgi:hypothetical protein
MTTAPKLPEGLEPVAWRVDWPAEIGIAPDRFYGADDAHRMNCHISYVHGAESPVVVPLVRLSDAQAALLALAAEKDAEIAAAFERDHEKAMSEAKRWAEFIPEIRGNYSAESVIALLGNLVTDLRARAAEDETLLRRCLAQLGRWQGKYGEHNPSWLPPAGDVKLAEDIDSALALAAKEAKQ